MTLKDKSYFDECKGSAELVIKERDIKVFIKKIKKGIKKQLKELRLEGIEVVSDKVIDKESGFEDE